MHVCGPSVPCLPCVLLFICWACWICCARQTSDDCLELKTAMLEFLSNVYLDTDDPIDGTELEVGGIRFSWRGCSKRSRDRPPYRAGASSLLPLCACDSTPVVGCDVLAAAQSPLWATMSYLGGQLRQDCETPGEGQVHCAVCVRWQRGWWVRLGTCCPFLLFFCRHVDEEDVRVRA